MKKTFFLLFAMIFVASFMVSNVSAGESVSLISGLGDKLIPSDQLISLPSTPLIDRAGWDWNNIREYSKPDNSLGKISIIDSFIFGSEIESLELKDNTDFCGVDCSAITNITIKKDTKLIDGVEFETIYPNGSRIKQNIRNYQFYILSGIVEKGAKEIGVCRDEKGNEITLTSKTCDELGYELKTEIVHNDIEDYQYVCRDKDGRAITLTSKTCDELGYELKKELVGTHREYEEKWLPYNYEVMPAGTYTVKLVGQKNPQRTVDWIVTSQGQKLSEWSVWGSITTLTNTTFNSNLVSADTTAAESAKCGFKVRMNANATIIKMDLHVNSDATRCFIQTSMPDGVLYTGTMSGTTCTFPSGSNLTAGTDYFLVADKNGVNWKRIYQSAWTAHSDTLLNWTCGQYSAGAGSCTATYGFTIQNVTLQTSTTTAGSSVTLNSPINNYNTSSSVLFNCSSTVIGGAGLTSIKLWTNSSGTWALNSTNTLTGATNTTTFTNTFADGNFLWTCQGCDSDGVCGFATSNRTLSMDTTAPTYVVNAPLVNLTTFLSSNNVTLNVTWADSLSNLANCSANTTDNATLVIYPCNTLKNFTFTNGGTKAIYVYANDTLGNSNSTTIPFFINYIRPNMIYTNPVVESENSNFNLFVTADNINSISANITYNNTIYPMTLASNNGTYANLTAVIQAPALASNNTLLNVSINYTLNGGNYSYNTTQTVYYLNPLVVQAASCTNAAYKFSLVDEENLSSINGTFIYNINFGISNSSYKLISGTLSNTNVFYICMNSTVSPTITIGQGQIYYTSSGYASRRFYIFGGSQITNNTINNKLYSLLTVNAQTFNFKAQNTGLTPYAGYFLSLMRWYPDLNQYNIVEMSKTDDTGSSVMSVKLNTVDYRIALYNSTGSLINLINPLEFSCSALPCTYNMLVNQNQNFLSMLNVQSSLTFNNNWGTFTELYNDPSQTLSLMNLTVYQDMPTYSLVVCSQSSASFTGVLSCNVSTYQGILRAEVYRSASPAQPIDNLIITIGNYAAGISSGLKLFIGFIISVFLVLIGVYISPIAALIFTIVAGLFSMFFEILDWYIVSGFVVLAIVIYNVLKRVG